MCYTHYTRDECNDCDTYHERMVTHRPCIKSLRTGQCNRSFDYKTIKRPNEDVDKCAKCLSDRTEAVRIATIGEIRVDLTPFWRRQAEGAGGEWPPPQQQQQQQQEDS
ncbi:uncharacterized protein PV06_05883 [Exophiala oligosperma]|uniref:Uncharacterized protein n=1 Tax=Exophiala oligosperma TaxID=215243 RepID=A0A0D2AQS4_9EURO|nr:uncharacterized protein PV06_05883 [Exophiala oligosperma]KIW42321.1 hypothetical protein PV06_05883 [Exophiala oligosperma]